MAPPSGRVVNFILMFLSLLSQVKGDCGPGRREVLERVSRVQLIGVSLQPLFRGRNSAPVTEECIERCKSSAVCRGIFIDYREGECKALTNSSKVSPSAKYRHAPEEPTVYFQKICIQVPNSCSSVSWVLERTPGYHIEAHDDNVVQDVPSRESCAEICLMQRRGECRSAEYNELLKECRLSKETRRSQVLSFQPTAQYIHYLENQCVAEIQSGVQCEFEAFINQDIGTRDMEVEARNREECVSICSAVKSFKCRAVSYQSSTSTCYLSADDIAGAGGLRALRPSLGMTFLQRTPCLDLALECSTDSMTVSLHTMDPFKGRLFAQDAPASCSQQGVGRTDTPLTINFQSQDCGVVDEGNGVVSSVIVVQHHPVVQRQGDKAIKLVCLFNTANKTVSSGYNFQFSGHGLSGGVASAVVNATAPVPRLRLRILGSNGKDITGARLGERLKLRLELDSDSVYNIMARNLVARSSDNSGEIVLLDDRGCPVDPLIFPPLTEIENGTKGMQGTFQAFKFSEDSVVRFQVNVQFCLQDCKPINCGSKSKSSGRRKRSTRSTLLMKNNIRKVGSPAVIVENKLAKSASAYPEDDLFHEMPLQKEIIVGSSRVMPLNNGVYPEERELERLSRLVCTTWEVLVCIIIALFILMLCLVLVTIMCLMYNKTRCTSPKEDDEIISTSSERGGRCSSSNSQTMSTVYRPSRSGSEHPTQTLRTLRSNLRD